MLPTSPIVGLQPTPNGTGLWLVSSDGAIFTTGAARYLGGANGPTSAVEQAVGIARPALGGGYWIAMSPSGPPLPPNSGWGRRIVYSNSQQRVWTVEENGRVSHTFLVSGRHGHPSAGMHQVYSKVPTSPSGNLTLPWTLRFAVSTSGNPIDFHGIPIDPSGASDRTRFVARNTAVARLRPHEPSRREDPLGLVGGRHHRGRDRHRLLKRAADYGATNWIGGWSAHAAVVELCARVCEELASQSAQAGRSLREQVARQRGKDHRLHV